MYLTGCVHPISSESAFMCIKDQCLPSSLYSGMGMIVDGYSKNTNFINDCKVLISLFVITNTTLQIMKTCN